MSEPAMYIPFPNDEYKKSVLRALANLPPDIKREIWKKIMDTPPPRKPYVMSQRMKDTLARWKKK